MVWFLFCFFVLFLQGCFWGVCVVWGFLGFFFGACLFYESISVWLHIWEDGKIEMMGDFFCCSVSEFRYALWNFPFIPALRSAEKILFPAVPEMVLSVKSIRCHLFLKTILIYSINYTIKGKMYRLIRHLRSDSSWDRYSAYCYLGNNLFLTKHATHKVQSQKK